MTTIIGLNTIVSIIVQQQLKKRYNYNCCIKYHHKALSMTIFTSIII